MKLIEPQIAQYVPTTFVGEAITKCSHVAADSGPF